MRLPLVMILAAGLLVGCNKADEAPPAEGLKIRTEKTAPPPLPESRGKLAVLPEGRSADPIPSPNAPPPQPEETAQPPVLPPPPPLAERAVPPPLDEDEELMRDCMDASAEGHPFGFSPTCSAILGR
jgi:hypothetical protein